MAHKLPSSERLPTGTVTFLFTDIVGSTPLWESHPELMAEALDVHNTALDRTIKAQGGMVFKTVGDAFQAAFPTAPQALRAAIAGQQALQAASWNELGELKVRMGLHTGEAEIDPGGDEYAVSHAKNRIGRIHSAAHGGQIVLSAETKELVDHHLPKGVTLKNLGEHRLKGMGIPEQLYQVVVSELESEFPPLGTESCIRHNLPFQPTPFIGREKELAELDALLANPDIRLVTIVGPGGMGKTRLAQAAAEGVLEDRQFSDGVFFVNLAQLAEPDQIASATAEALGLRLQGDAEHTLKQQLLEYLQSAKVLLLLDNFEHLLDGVELVVDLLAETAGVQVLATSRERLHLRMEQVYPIEGLEFPDWETPEDAAEYTAVRLFLQSAHRNQPDFILRDGDELTYLARICRLVGGMPLALELAAAWVDMLPLSEIAAGLQEGLDILETEARDMPARHRSVRAAIDHYWGKLDEKERLVFARLSVFRGGFTRQAAQAVADADLRQLGRLVNKSFLKYDSSADRYQVHELMRQYGAEKLVNPETVRTQHLDFFVAYVKKVRDGESGPEPEIWVKRMLADMDNFRAAMDWAAASGQAQSGLWIGGTLSFYWIAIGDWREGRQRLERLLALPEAAEHSLARGYALNQAGGLACGLGDYETGFAYYEEAKTISRELGQAGKQLLGWILLDHAAKLENRDMAAAQQMFNEGMAVLREVGEPWQLWLVFGHRGWIAIRRGDFDRAYAALYESLVFVQKFGHKWLSGVSMGWLGYLLYLQGNFNAARSHLEQSLAILGPLGDLRHQPLDVLGAVALLQEDPQEAVACFEERLEMHRRQGSKVYFVRDLSNLGIAYRHLGDHVQAVAHSHEALSLTGDATDTTDQAVCLLGVAGIQPASRLAAQLLAAVQTAFDRNSLFIVEPLYQTEIERIEKTARAALGQADFEAAYAEGKTMPVDKVIAMTLAKSEMWGLDRKAID